MAEEAFALSPISARAALPSEADYGAIREAFMETARGRWFLSEYAKRNRNADTTMVLDAVARIEQTIAAQKPAPANELIESLGAIRAIVGEARASVAQAIGGLEAGDTLKAAQGGARIIREIAWTLRECGADVRICDLLDAQIGAIDSGHRQIAAINSDAILATFDQLMRRIGDLAGADDAISANGEMKASGPEQAASPPPAAAEPPPAVPIIEAVAKMAAALTHDPAQTFKADAPRAPDEPAIGKAHREPAIPARPAAMAEIAVHQTQAEVAVPVEVAPHSEVAQHREPVAPQLSTNELPQSGDAATLDLETAHEDAVLDLVALEMAAEDFVEQAGPIHVEQAGPIHIEPAAVEPAPAETVSADPVQLPRPVNVPVPAAAEASPIASASRIDESVPKPPRSLGAALLSSGVIAKPAVPGIDPLAPIRRMTQIEKIAFFS
jgi:hypothetical protein